MRQTATYLGSVLIALHASATFAAEPSPDFTRDVAPILAKYCAGCHNSTDREGDLSVETFAELQKGGGKRHRFRRGRCRRELHGSSHPPGSRTGDAARRQSASYRPTKSNSYVPGLAPAPSDQKMGRTRWLNRKFPAIAHGRRRACIPQQHGALAGRQATCARLV